MPLGLLRAIHPSNLPRLGEIDVDGRVLAFTALTCLVTTLAFGLAPALQSARQDAQRALQSGGRSGTSAARHRVRNALIVGEVALSVVLLIGAGLLVRSFLSLQQVRPGFDASDVLTFQLALARRPLSHAPTADARSCASSSGGSATCRASRTWVSSRSSRSPAAGRCRRTPTTRPPPGTGRASPPTAGRSRPEYFTAMNTRLLAGRAFTWDDAVGTPPVIVIDETLARQAWPGQTAVGKQLQLGPTGEANNTAEVVGVVEHERSHDLARAVRPLIFYSMGQQIPTSLDVALETSVAPGSVANAAAAVVHDMDKDLAVTRLAPMALYVSEGMAQARFSLLLMAALGGIALALAAVGIFGVIAYTVTQRTREFGIRIALGEDPAHTRRSVVLRSMRLVLISIGVGLGASLVLARLLAGQLYGVSPTDPLTFAGIAALLAFTALVASYLPARRATRVDPVTALRAE